MYDWVGRKLEPWPETIWENPNLQEARESTLWAMYTHLPAALEHGFQGWLFGINKWWNLSRMEEMPSTLPALCIPLLHIAGSLNDLLRGAKNARPYLKNN
jgi:hypothetical protein